MGEYIYLEDEAIADVAFKAIGEDITELFYQAGMATSKLQTEIDTLTKEVIKEIDLTKSELDRLLNSFLSEILFLKDADLFFVKDIDINVTKVDEGWNVIGQFFGSTFDPEINPRHNDLKAITWHNFYVKEIENGWECYVLIDI